jgi:hypothetical protein
MEEEEEEEEECKVTLSPVNWARRVRDPRMLFSKLRYVYAFAYMYISVCDKRRAWLAKISGGR